MGRRIPDLVLALDADAEGAPEFTIQCEIALSKPEADLVAQALYGHPRIRGGIEQARATVVARIDAAPRWRCRQIVNHGFDELSAAL